MKYGDLKLGQIEALVNKVGGMEAVQRILADTVKVVLEVIKRLLEIGEADAPNVDELVVNEDKLREKCNIKWVGDNFRKFFFGKTLKEVKARKLILHKLQERATGQQIMNEVGANPVEFLLYLFFLVRQQKNGEDGPLLTNGYGNIIIVEIDGVAWAVNVDWNSGNRYWDVEASELGGGWNDGNQVLS